MPTSVSKSHVLLIFVSLPGQIMTSIVIQFVRLVAPFTSLEKVVNHMTGRLSTKKDSAELIVQGALKLIVSSRDNS